VADLVVINKTDLVSPQRLAEVKQQVETVVPHARTWETTFGEVPLDLIFDDQMREAMAGLQEHNKLITTHNAHEHGGEFATWTFRSQAEWSFSALQRAVEQLPRGIFRAKGLVRLNLETNDYGILQVTGRRGWLKLVAPESDQDEAITTELVFIGKPGSTSNEELRIHFEEAWQAANTQGDESYIVTDLRAFNVIFA
jgi:G3E family GTPase